MADPFVNVFRLEDFNAPGSRPYQYRRRDYYKVSLVAGDSNIHYGGVLKKIRGQALVFTNPLKPYTWERLTEPQTGYVCMFKEEFTGYGSKIKKYPVFSSTDHAIFPLSRKAFLQYEKQFSKMYNELKTDYIYKYEFIKALLLEIIHEAQRQIAVQAGSTDSRTNEKLVALFYEVLEQQFPVGEGNRELQFRTASDFAGLLNVHVNHLNKILKKITGSSTTELVNYRVLQEAKLLLTYSDLSINDIALCLKFAEPNHFSGFFKLHTGSTPSQYRKKAQD
jgi:AraC-like DNA-binding protein